MNSFIRTRDESLSIALSSKESLQSSISAAKHGDDESNSKLVLDLRSMLYGSTSPTKTICIHHCANMYSVSYLWYSMCNVHIRDICYTLIYGSSTSALILDNNKLSLYVIKPKDVVEGLNAKEKKAIASYGGMKGGRHVLVLDNPPHNIMSRHARVSYVGISEGDWEVRGTMGEIRTYFKGERYSALSAYCDVVLSTDVSVTVSYLGKVKASILYRKYVKDQHLDVYLSKVLTCRQGIEDYGNASRRDVVKRATMRDQIGTMVEASLLDLSDNLSCIESRLMLGLGVDSDGFLIDEDEYE